MANEVVKFDQLWEQEKPNIIGMLPSNEDRDRWWALVYEMWRRPELRECAEKNPYSLLNALKKFANWGLVPDGDEGFINVYNIKQKDGSYLPEASPEAMYKGWIRRAVDAGVVMHAVADVLRDGDTVDESITPQGRVLRVNRQHGKRGRKFIGAYALYWLPNGLMDYELFEEEDIEAVKKAALRNAQRRKQDAGLSPAWQFFEGEQIKKSIIKRGLKRMRGRRDTEAGQRFSEMINNENARFDTETTAEEIPDNPPTAVGEPVVEVVPDKPTPDRTLNKQEQTDVMAFVKTQPFEVAVGFKDIMFETCGVTALAEVKLADLDKLIEAVREAAAEGA